jgi:hypothetical protein
MVPDSCLKKPVGIRKSQGPSLLSRCFFEISQQTSNALVLQQPFRIRRGPATAAGHCPPDGSMPQRDLRDTDYLPGKWLTHQQGAPRQPVSKSTVSISEGFGIPDLPAQSQQPDGVFLQDHGPHFGFHVELLEVRHPAVRRDGRIVRSEQHPVLDQRVGILHQVRREILR